MAALTGVGLLAALVGTAGGITTLVSYPALLVLGIPPFAANAANIVAAVACWPGSAFASRRELAGHRRWVLQWSIVAAAGGTVGTVLLLTTPPGVFVEVVPWLVLTGALLLFAQPWLSARRSPGSRGRAWLLPVGLAAASVYNGYFGAGSGIMILALLLLTLDVRLPIANARKNMLVGAASPASTLVLALYGPVPWATVAPLAAGMFVGSLLGPVVARRLPANIVRVTAAALGVVLAAQLWLSA